MTQTMKIYFAGSIRGGRQDVGRYHELIAYIQSFGTVLTKHVGDIHLTESGDDGTDDTAIHDRDMAWLKCCDLVIAEITIPSLGVGYELGWACAMNKPILCVYRPGHGKKISAMIMGCRAITTVPYNDMAHAREIIRRFIESHTPWMGTD